MFVKLKQLKSSVLFIVLVALAIRLIVVAFLYQGQLNPRRDHWPFGYEAGRIARSIALGEGFANPLFQKTGPTAWMAPLYPCLVAGVFKLSGIYTATSAVILLSLNSLFSALSCVAIFFMARESFGSKVAICAAWAWALFPYAIYLSADWIWETCLTTLLLSLLVWVTLRLERLERRALSTRLAEWVGFGTLWGITALTNPAVLALLPFFVGWLCYGLHRRRQGWRLEAGVALAALLLIVAPWFLRNYRTFHQFIPFRDNFWLEISTGNRGDTSLQAAHEALPAQSARAEEEYNRLGELTYMAERRREATAFIRNNPLWFAGVTFRRTVLAWTGFWSLPTTGRFREPFDPEEPFDPAHIVFNTTLSILAIVGLFRSLRRHATTIIPYAAALTIFPLLYYVSNVDVRYRHPIDPEIIVLAAYACVTFRAGMREAAAQPKAPRVERIPTLSSV